MILLEIRGCKVKSLCLVGNVIVLFHSYTYEDCYESTVNNGFTYLTGYRYIGTAQLSLLILYLVVSLYLYPDGQPATTLFGGRSEGLGKA